MTDIIVPLINPRQLTTWKRRFTFCYPDIVQAHADYAEWKRGRCDLDFVVAANERAISALVEIYDMYAHDTERKRLRNSFRKIVARHGGRLAPYYDDLHASIRSRLKEHDLMVRHGLDPADEPRLRP
jgi:hypothetical protein